MISNNSKGNPNHDAQGKFTSSNGSASSNNKENMSPSLVKKTC